MRGRLPWTAVGVLGLAACGGGGSTPVDPSTPTPPPFARIVRGPYLQSAPEGAATVAWYQDVAVESRVEWRPEGGSWQEAASTAGASLRYEAALGGLQVRSRYSYRVRGGAGGPMPDAAGRTEFSFRTPRPDAVKLAFMGDTGSGEPRQFDVGARLATEDPPPDAITIVGDLIYPHGEDAGYDPQFFAPYRSLLSAIPFYAALGNHDYEVEAGKALLDVCTLPGKSDEKIVVGAHFDSWDIGQGSVDNGVGTAVGPPSAGGAGITISWPMLNRRGSLMPLASWISSTVTPNWRAMGSSVSPFWIT